MPLRFPFHPGAMLGFLAAFLAFLPGPAAQAAPPATRDIVLGQLVDYAGKHGEASRDYVAGARVYFDSINAKGGVNGLRVKLVTVDLAGDEPAAAKRMRDLLDDAKVDALFGFVGDEAVALAARDPDVRAGRAALFAPLAGREAPADAAGIFFTRPSYEAELRQVIEHFRALQLTRFGIVHGGDEQGRWVAGALAKLLAVHGLRVAGEHVIARLDAVSAAQLAELGGADAQALLVVGDTVPVAEFIKRYRPQAPGANVVALSTVNHRTVFELLGPKLAHGTMITQVVPNPLLAESPLAKEHLDAFRRFRDEPPSHLSLEGFVAAKAFVEALRGTAPIDRGAIVAALRRTPRLDLRGMEVDLTREGRRRSRHIDIAMIRRSGGLLQ